MSWFKKYNECPFTCPVLEQIRKSEVLKAVSRPSKYSDFSPSSVIWQLEQLDGKASGLSKDIRELKAEAEHVRTLLETNIMVGRPSAINSILARLDVVELRERELRQLLYKQIEISDGFEARIAELERKNKEININIITKTEEVKVELQKGE